MGCSSAWCAACWFHNSHHCMWLYLQVHTMRLTFHSWKQSLIAAKPPLRTSKSWKCGYFKIWTVPIDWHAIFRGVNLLLIRGVDLKHLFQRTQSSLSLCSYLILWLLLWHSIASWRPGASTEWLSACRTVWLSSSYDKVSCAYGLVVVMVNIPLGILRYLYATTFQLFWWFMFNIITFRFTLISVLLTIATNQARRWAIFILKCWPLLI